MNDTVKITLLAFLTLLLILVSSTIIGSIYSVPDGNVALIKIHNNIVSMKGVTSSALTSDELISLIDDAESNPNVEAIVLSINSGGGMAVASKEVANKVANSSKPVITWIRELGTSGAYLIASGSDYVISDELSIIGSIGATMSYLEFSETLTDYGVEYNRLVSGEHKDMGSMYKNLTQEEKEIFMNLINNSYSYFINFVKQHRNLSNESVEVVQDGRVMSGEKGYELGLVDELGSKQEVTEYLNSINITDVVYEEYSSSSILSPLGLLSRYDFNQVIPTYE